MGRSFASTILMAYYRRLVNPARFLHINRLRLFFLPLAAAFSTSCIIALLFICAYHDSSCPIAVSFRRHLNHLLMQMIRKIADLLCSRLGISILINVLLIVILAMSGSLDRLASQYYSDKQYDKDVYTSTTADVAVKETDVETAGPSAAPLRHAQIVIIKQPDKPKREAGSEGAGLEELDVDEEEDMAHFNERVETFLLAFRQRLLDEARQLALLRN